VATPEQDPQDVLREEILGDARKQAERALRRAQQDAGALVAKAEAASALERERLLSQARTTAERHTALVLASVPVEAGRMRAARIETLLQSVHDEARKTLERRAVVLSREDLLGLAANAARSMAGERFVLQISSAEHATLGDGWLGKVRRLAGKPDLEIQLGDDLSEGEVGLVLRDDTGRQVVDHRLTARLGRMWPALRIAIAARLGFLEQDAPAEKSS
jgi:vacuolar-type H+-ATPase subunit E/Vma4